MGIGKITKSVVERLAPGELLWDAGHREVVKGFGARRQRRDIFYLVRYRWAGDQRFDSIGRHGSPWTPEGARKEAKRILGLVVSGTDPRGKAVGTDSFSAEVDRYLERKRPAMKPRAFEEVERHLRRHAEPLGKLRVGAIDRRTIALRLAEIERASGPVARNRVRSSLSAFFGWAVREGLIEINPVSGTGKAEEGESRERTLTDPELAEVWRSSGGGDFGDIVRLLILTGQRREEIGGLRWSEVDLERQVIVLPPARTKNRREHSIPLAPTALTILRARGRRGRELVFGLGRGGFSGWSDGKEGLPALKKEWRLHDLRRSVATGMAELGVLPHIIEAVLNHVSGHRAGVAGIYNRARYEGEVRAALERWAVHVGRITSA